MDILHPECVWIENRCYRVYDKSFIFNGNKFSLYNEEVYESDAFNMNEIYNESIVTILEEGDRYKHSFNINSCFFGHIIGTKGATLQRLKANTNTQINVPRFGQEGNIVITGNNRKDIVAARYQIDMLIKNSRNKLQFTHFIGIPVNSKEIIEIFYTFKHDILKNYSKGVRKIEQEMFQTPEKLHVTIIMLVLLNEDDKNKATNALINCKQKIIIPYLKKKGPIKLELRGIECMQDDPSMAKVLYIQPHDETGCLQELSDMIADYIVDQGLARKKSDKIKLHVTAINVRFARVKLKDHKKFETFDATNILQNFKNIYFGKINLSTIHLSQRHTKSKDGFYQATAKINLLDNL